MAIPVQESVYAYLSFFEYSFRIHFTVFIIYMELTQMNMFFFL